MQLRCNSARAVAGRANAFLNQLYTAVVAIKIDSLTLMCVNPRANWRYPSQYCSGRRPATGGFVRLFRRCISVAFQPDSVFNRIGTCLRRKMVKVMILAQHRVSTRRPARCEQPLQRGMASLRSSPLSSLPLFPPQRRIFAVDSKRLSGLDRRSSLGA
ncbi:hypothetical protein KCP76_01440 [Salmonella enterica subsp. enterica serovar Weltevreden]|nr:hypothetical protein KCP76_01440 [Salmonella enterica subsp. enterica serovar Weltevreden]